MKLLLVSATGSPYFEHCRQELTTFLDRRACVGFISAASLFDEADYFRRIRERLVEVSPPIARELLHIRLDLDPLRVLSQVEAIVVGGGNTFALLKRLKESRLLDPLRQMIMSGLPYVGSSAGANVAGPNILTTNDWNVVGLTWFESLGVVPFNLNPHYSESALVGAPNSETRDQRIREYHQIWSNPVVAIDERAILKVVNRSVCVEGHGRARLFSPSDQPRWFSSGEYIQVGDWMPLSQHE